MPTMDMDPLLELVHTLGAAVEQLTVLVTAMPAKVDAKLAEISAGFTQSIVQVRAQMDELASEAGAVRGQLNSLAGAFGVQVGDVRQELSQVIADNRTAAETQVQQLGERFVALEAGINGVEASLSMVDAAWQENARIAAVEVADLHKTCAEEFAGQRTLISEVRTACDTTDLHASMQRLDTRVAELGKGYEDIAVGVANLGLTIDGVADQTADEIERLEKHIVPAFDPAPINARIDDLEERQFNAEAKADATAPKVAELETKLQTLNKASSEVTLEHAAVLQTVVAKVNDLEQNDRNHELGIKAVSDSVKQIVPFDPAPITQWQLATEQRFSDAAIRLTTVEDVLEQNDTTLQGVVASVQAIVPFDPAPVYERVDTAIKLADETAARIVARINTIADVQQRHGDTLEEHGQRVQSLAAHIDQVPAPFDPSELVERIVGVGITVEAIGKGMDSVSGRVDQLAQQVPEPFDATPLTLSLAELRTEFVESQGTMQRLGARVEEHTARLDGYEFTHTALRGSIETLQTGYESIGSEVAALAVTSQHTTARMQHTVEHLQELTERSHTFAMHEEVSASAQRLAETLSSFGEEFSATMGNMQASLRSDFAAEVQTLGDAVEARIAALPTPPEIPPPFDPTPLRMELLTQLSAQLAELPAPTLPEPEFDLAFEDQTLVVSLTMGNNTITRSTTLDFGIEYLGVYKHGEDYKAGNLVTYKGSMWIAKAKPTGEPGKDITGWQLAVKCGRDGKDATPTRAYTGHASGRVYRETDFLRINNRLWQCSVKETTFVPEPGDITSSAEWTLIGGIQ